MGHNSMLTNEGLDLLKRVYEIEDGLGARLPERTEIVATPKEGYVTIYKLMASKDWA